MAKGKLYLLPTTLGGSVHASIPPGHLATIAHVRTFIVEEVRSARRFLRAMGNAVDFEEVEFLLLNEHTKPEQREQLMIPLIKGKDVVLMSEAGLPCVADPGNVIVKSAHEFQIQVVPLTGPSSIFLTLMASGFNGQSFTFNGYLPRERPERIRKIKQLELQVQSTGQTQLFMDAPYRNNQVLEDLIAQSKPDTLLCIGTEVTTDGEKIATKTMAEWKNAKPDLHKKLVMFALGR
jgi:16S rRNA (cytidine1402-2'-O)-methyltransferase